jgi:sugar phosphate isomerase/epimerase
MKHPINRRGFLTSSVKFSVLTATGFSLTGISAEAEVPASGKISSRLKTSLNAFSFDVAMTRGMDRNGPDMTLLDVVDFCAEHNIDAIDPTGYYFPGYPNVPTDAYIAEFKRRTFDLGVEISGTGIRNNFATADKALRREGVDLAKQWIEVAAKLGAPVIRVFAGQEESGVDRKDIYQWMADDLRSCAEYGQRFGVVVGVQNHGDFLQNAEQTIRLVKQVDHPWLGVILDTGNFHDDPYGDIEAVLPYTVNFQLKESPYGKDSADPIDLDRFVSLVRASGYRGYVPIETLTASGANPDQQKLVPSFMAKVKAAFARGSQGG